MNEKSIRMKQAILQRKSVRTYMDKLLTQMDEEKVKHYLAQQDNGKGPFGNRVKIVLQSAISVEGQKIFGTYGVIRNAPAYLIAQCSPKRYALIDCGYVFERLVLFLESNRLGTCWLGGTFERHKVKVELIDDDWIIPIVSPVGYTREKRTLQDMMMRQMAKSHMRKSIDELFVCGPNKKIIQDESCREECEYLRWAPSASNQQPWRVWFCDDLVHFFVKRTKGYGKALPFDIQMVDMGIILAHYQAIHPGSVYEILEDIPLWEGCEYIASSRVSKEVDA